jgi:hypothetical protein
MPTYEHSGETVHPDFASVPAWWGDQASSYLAITPYPNGDATKENPSLFAGDAGDWSVPPDAPNPVRFPMSGYLSDPDIVFDDDTRELLMYYRQVTGSNRIYLIRTADARHWSDPQLVAEGPNHVIVSPAVVRRAAGDWLMWSVNSGAIGCDASSTQLELRRSMNGTVWSAPQVVNLPLPPSGLMPWHIDVQWIPSREEYWAIFNAKDAFNCGTTAVYLATSPDGVTWSTQPEPIAVAGDVDELKDIVYRTTFRVDPGGDEVSLWYSGARRDQGRYIWKTVFQRVAVGTLFHHPSLRSQIEMPRRIPPSAELPNPPLG